MLVGVDLTVLRMVTLESTLFTRFASSLGPVITLCPTNVELLMADAVAAAIATGLYLLR